MRQLLCALALACVGCGKPASFQVRESFGQLYVTHAPVGQTLEVVSASGAVVGSGTVDELGSLALRGLPAGKGYVVRVKGSTPREETPPLEVRSDAAAPPPQSFYDGQELTPGFNYLTTRDGTKLAAYVTVPKGVGPFPTVVTYAGYAMARPARPISGAEFLCGDFPTFCEAPYDPSALFASVFGYATVSVNVRGTGCSGGAYDYFEPAQVLDGYDVIETVAAQRWVRGHRVGMVGLSFPGIAQLFVAASQPPSLAAIAPMAVVESTVNTMRPGGLLNEGFAVEWINAVLKGARPYGQGWEQARVDGGDEICRENQLLHGQFVDNIAQARAALFHDPAIHGRLDPVTFVDRIKVPVFLVGLWQDEQTGPYFFTLAQRFTNAPALRLTATNGVHKDGFSPQVLMEWQQFLELFVAQRKPLDPTQLRNVSTVLFEQVFDGPLALPPARFSSYASHAEALAAWKAEPPVRLIFDTGAGLQSAPGAPQGTFERSFSQYPPREATVLRLYLTRTGALSATPPTDAAAASAYAFDVANGARVNVVPHTSADDRLPAYAWTAPALGKALVYESEPMPRAGLLFGPASFDLYLRSPTEEADVQVTLSEVRADGQEVYLQSGWLKAGHRQPGPDATATWPAQTYGQGVFAPLPLDQPTLVRVGTGGFAHALRAGSKLRAIIDTPGGTRARWTFGLDPIPDGTRFAVAHDASRPSSVAVSYLEDSAIPAAPPPCPGIRGQPCRAVQPFMNLAQP